MAEFSLEKICCEFKETAPFFYTTLMAAGIPPGSKKKDIQWLPSVAAAGSIILKERCRLMNGFEILFMLCMKHTGFRAMSNIMSSLKVGVMSTYYNKKCDLYGVEFDANLKVIKKEDELVLSANAPKPQTCNYDNLGTDTYHLSSGYKFPFDNFDLYQKVCDMAEGNPVYGFDIAKLDNEKLLPNCMDHVLQRSNYIEIVERIITGEIPYLSQFTDVVRQPGPSRGRAGPGAIFWSGPRMFKGATRQRNPWASGLMRFGLIY